MQPWRRQSLTSWRSKLRVLKPLIKQASTTYLIDEVVGKNGVPIITYYKGPNSDLGWKSEGWGPRADCFVIGGARIEN